MEEEIGGPVSNVNWKKEVKEAIKTIQEMKVKDRLDVCAALGYSFMTLHESINNWLKWISNPLVMKEFSEQELKDFYNVIKKNVVELLELDYESTDKYDEVIKKAEKSVGKINQRQKFYG